MDKEKMYKASPSDFDVQNENSLFVVGGYRIMMIIVNTVVERYDSAEDIWPFCAPISPIHVCGAAVINRTLYVIGYHDGLEMKALEYNIIHDDLSDIVSPKQCRTRFEIVNFWEELYIVLGGRTEENNITSSVVKYCTTNNEW